jgi:hypothetical protein
VSAVAAAAATISVARSVRLRLGTADGADTVVPRIDGETSIVRETFTAHQTPWGEAVPTREQRYMIDPAPEGAGR